jgi:hypothetical protein
MCQTAAAKPTADASEHETAAKNNLEDAATVRTKYAARWLARHRRSRLPIR